MSRFVTSADDTTTSTAIEPSEAYVRKHTFAAFGEGFEPASEFLSTDERVLAALGTTRENTPPEAINPWECRIGGSRFFVPPININVSTLFKSGNIAGGALRQQSAPKFNSGHTETVITMTLYFASYEEIWGFEDDIFRINFDQTEHQGGMRPRGEVPNQTQTPGTVSDDESIDKFLASLRGLIAQFKYSPFLPIRNEYLNRAFGITGVVMKDMSISSIPDYPFCMAVTLTMYKFNHKVYLPMIEHFDQAIHWGKFRQYMGRAAGRLAQSSRPIREFSLSDNSLSSSAIDVGEIRPLMRTPREVLDDMHSEDIPATQIYKRHSAMESNRLELYYPYSIPARVDLPDLSDLRYEDMIWSDQRRNWWQRYLGSMGFDVATNRDQYAQARSIAEENDTGFIANQNEFKTLTRYLQRVRLGYEMLNRRELNNYIERRFAEEEIRNPSSAEAIELRNRIQNAWFYAMYRFFLEDPSLARALALQDRRGRQLTINEWEVPMVNVNLDMDTVKIQGISVSLGNIIARLQLQMQDEPTHQHIGGSDTQIDIALRIAGPNAETELVKLRTMYEHTNGLARLGHGNGVLGFMGLKNIITELVGIRYVVPLAFEVDTVPGSPHVYDVRLSFTDFDIFQQKRETLAAEQQAELAEAFGKRNPFFRIKQLWGMFNAYPDFPLSVRDENKKIVGHLDPDFYFKSFKTLDDDIFLSEKSRELANFDPATHDPIRESIDRLESLRSDNTVSGPLEGPGIHVCVGMGEGGSKEYVSIDDGGVSLYSDKTPYMINGQFNEAHASTMLTEGYDGLTPPAGYMQPYLDGSSNPWGQFDAMKQDMLYRDDTGRMIRAYPTYMLWLISEGGSVGGMRLFDNFYGLQSVIDMSIVQSEDILGDTLVLRVSNLYSRLSSQMKEILDEDKEGDVWARMINTQTRRNHKILSQQGYIADFETIQLKPGVRVHLRVGYGANPNRLNTVFNGTVTQVENGEILTIVAQSDAMELGALVNSDDEKAHTGNIQQKGFALGLSEPRDLMLTLLTKGSTTAKQLIAHATRGEIFSENRYGIRHFGMMMYAPLDENEIDRHGRNKHRISTILSDTVETTEQTNDFIDNVDSPLPGSTTATRIGMRGGTMAGITSIAMLDVLNSAWVNLTTSRDYEIFKRNIYPGNGTGIGQFHGGDFGEYGLAMAVEQTASMRPTEGHDTDATLTSGFDGQAAINAAVALHTPAGDGESRRVRDVFMWPVNSPIGRAWTHTFGNVPRVFNNSFQSFRGVSSPGNQTTGASQILLSTPFREVSFRAQTYMKTVWDLFQVCAALLPDYIVAVRPFEDRSTVFYGKPHWLYTSGLIPVSTGGPAVPFEDPDKELEEIMDEIDRVIREEDSAETFEEFFAGIEDWRSSSSDPNSSTAGLSFTGDASGANLAARAALAAGFNQEEAITMVAIAGAESRWNPKANNAGTNRDGTVDHGMWQINQGAHGSWVDFSRIQDPFYNAEVAYKLVQRKKRAGNPRIFGDWAVHEHWGGRNRAYANNWRQFLPKAEKAVMEEIRSARSGGVVSQGDTGGNVAGVRSDEEIAAAVRAGGFRNKDRSDAVAEEIWNEVREHFSSDNETIRAFLKAPQLRSLTESEKRNVYNDVYQDVVGGFINFMYENPYARGWVARTANRRVGGINSLGNTATNLISGVLDIASDTFGVNTPSIRKWDLGPLHEVFIQYISHGDKAAVEHMKNNHGMGRDHSNLVLRTIEGVGAGLNNFWKKTTDLIKKPFQAIGGIATGLLQFMQISMLQLNQGLNLVGDLQKQQNALNEAFNDSIYYSAGRNESGQIVNPMLYFTDNPFTREYAEPVVEIREPFQRLHTIGSSQHILSNRIIQSSEDVATVVTAKAEGGDPITVHFDKAAPAEKQFEKTVDTGLFYDHPKGWFGLKKMFNPIQTSRAASMALHGNAMSITAKRVALSHLKKSLQDIYKGEVTVIGDASIRPHDLVYLGDTYSRMYGFVEVEQVVHHFTPETGFITSITPNAAVTINDPARFSFMSQLRSQADTQQFRNTMRTKLRLYAYNTGVGDDMPGVELAGDSNYTDMLEIIQQAETQIQNSLQYTGGNTAIIKSIASFAAAGGLVSSLTAAGGVPGAAVGGVLGWKAWTWVRDNLLDQHGCWVSYLTQNGMPMDAGLNYNQGMAVGHHHTRSFIIKGLKIGDISAYGPGGSQKIRYEDVIPALKWDETGPNEQARQVSLFVDRINAEVRRMAGRETFPGGFEVEAYWVRINRVIDGDTFVVSVLDQMKYGEITSVNMSLGNGRIRPAGFDAPEDEFKTRSSTERQMHINDPGVRATEFARSLLMPNGQPTEVAIRIDRANKYDRYGRVLAYIFHRAPEGLDAQGRKEFMLNAATRNPPISYDSYMPDGQPYTFDWEMIAAGHGKVFTNDMKRSQAGRGVRGGY